MTYLAHFTIMVGPRTITDTDMDMDMDTVMDIVMSTLSTSRDRQSKVLSILLHISVDSQFKPSNPLSVDGIIGGNQDEKGIFWNERRNRVFVYFCEWHEKVGETIS